jgi:hypothetical protein
MKQQSKWTLGSVAAVVAAMAVAGTFGTAQAGEVRATLAADCPTSTGPKSAPGEEIGVLAGAILTSLSGTLVDTGIAALKKAVTPETMTMNGSFLQPGLYLWSLPPGEADKEKPDLTKAKIRLNPKLGCLVVAVGDFGQSAQPWALPFSTEKKAAAENLQKLMGLSAPPTMLLEAAYLVSPDGSAVTWRPRRVYVGKFLNASFWAGKQRGVQISFSVSRPGADKAVYAQEFKFDDVAEGFHRQWTGNELEGGQQGTWGALPANSKDKPSNKAVQPTEMDPFTLEVQVVETPKPYKLAQAFAGAVEANKDAIKTEVALLVDPNKKGAADKAAAAAALTAKESSVTAVQGYLEAVKTATDSCAAGKVGDASGVLSCQLARDKALVAQAKAQAACASATTAACGSMESLKIPAEPKTV